MPDPGYQLKLADNEMLGLLQDRRQKDIVRPDVSGQAGADPAAQEPAGMTATARAKRAKTKRARRIPKSTPRNRPATSRRSRKTTSPRQHQRCGQGRPGGLPVRRPPDADGLEVPQQQAGPGEVNVLALETTCDETAAAIVNDRLEVLASVVASQDDLHRRFGGVVPEIASRAHLERILPVIDQALSQARLSLKDLDAVAVANTPGLADRCWSG